MPNNVIEVLLRARDQASGVLGRFTKSVFNLRNVVRAAFTGLAAREIVQAVDGLTLLQSKLRLVTESNEELAVTQERLIALAQRTRTQLSSTVELYSRVARSSEQLNATQSELLQFTESVSQAIQISGNTAQEASAGVIQLAQALASGVLRGDELRSVLEQMPRVATAIADGLGTTIGQLRALGAAGKLTSEQVFDALLSQSGKLREEFAKLTPTIGQSFTQLFNALTVATAEFAGATDGTKTFSGAIRDLSEFILNNRATFVEWGATISRTVKEIKLSLTNAYNNAVARAAQVNAFLQDLSSAAVTIATPGVRTPLNDAADANREFAAKLLAQESERYGKAAKEIQDAFDKAMKDAEELRNRIRNQKFESAADSIIDQIFGAGEGPKKVKPIDIEEFNVTLRHIDLTPYEQVLADMEELTKTSTEKQLEQYQRIKETLKFLSAQDLITKEQFNARLGEAQDELLPEFDIEKIRDLYLPVIQTTNETAEIMKGIWQGVGQSLQRSLSDAFYNAKLDVRSLVDVARRAFADMASALLTSGLQKQLARLFGFLGGSTGSGVIDLGFAVFGTKAGGGNFDGPQIVGEDGPEVVTGRGRVFNRRQLAFAGAGAPVNFSPVTNISIIERENPNQTKQEIFQAVALENAKQQAEFVRTLRRSGVEVKG